jgi:uncharacterized repeat protein (TIGR01451 family)
MCTPFYSRFFVFRQFRQFNPGLHFEAALISRCRVQACALLSLVLVHGISFASEPSSQLFQIPMHFEANQGQAAQPVEFLSRGSGYTLFLTPAEAVLSLRSKKSLAADAGHFSQKHLETAVDEARLGMTLIGANHQPRSEGIEPLAGVVNYLIGSDPAAWRTGIPTFGKVKYHEIYSGVDLIYYGNQQQLEYDFIIHPGADPKKIGFRLNGADRIEIAQDGELLVHVRGGVVRWHRPFGYQESSTGRAEVPTRFILKNGYEVSFEVADYDRSRPLIIDPVVVYSTYLGGSGGDYALGIAVHTGGSVYVLGDTTSLNFPTVTAYRTTPVGSNDLFVTKLNPSGNTLIYSTYIGGSGDEFASGIALDAAGNAFITGYTDSGNYPTRNAAYNGNAGFFDIFLTKLGVGGSNLIYSTYLGGAGDDFGRAVAVDASGSAYVTGRTFSRGTGNGTFPTTQGAYQRNNGNKNTIGADAFVTKFDTNGAVAYSSFLGGDSEEKGNAIAVDGQGNAFVVGEVSSVPTYPAPPSSDFPLVNAFQSQFNQGNTDPFGGATDGFLTKFNAAGSGLIFSTFLGGFDDDMVTGIALDGNGRIAVTGITSSTNFPTLNAAQPQNGGMSDDPDFPGPDAFVTEFAANGTTLLYSTYLGGAVDEFPFVLDLFGIAADKYGNLYIAGQTRSFDFPVTQGADQVDSKGSTDAFVAKINPAVSGPASLIYASLLSGSSGMLLGSPDNEAGAIAVDNNANFYVAGITSATNFPITAGAYRGTNRGGFSDSFVTKFSSPPDLSVTMFATPNPTIIGSNVTYTIRINNNGVSTFNGITNVVQFPTNIRFGTISSSVGTFRTNAGLVTFSIGALTNNAVVTQTIVATSVDPGTYTNTATVSSMESPLLEPNKSNNTASVVAMVRGIADLAVTQSAGAGPMFVSSNLIYIISITNKGPSMANFVVLTNPLPANLALVSATTTLGICTTNTNGVVCSIGTIPSGAGARLTINTIAIASGAVANTPGATGFEADFTPANNSSVLVNTIIPLTELGLGMAVSTNQVYAANNIVFTLRVTNNGPSSATGVVLTNPFPAGTLFVSATTSSGTTNLSGGGIGFAFASLASNAIATATVMLKAPVNGSTILNSATVSNSAGADPFLTNNFASVSALVIATADLGLSQSANPTSLGVSSNTTFTILLTNRGPSSATNVVLIDSLPTSFSVVSAQSTLGSCQVLNNTITCNVGIMTAGMSGTATIVAKAKAYGIFTNAANVSSVLADLVSTDNQAKATVTVSDLPNSPALTITRNGTNVILSWSTNATALGFILQSKTSLSTNTQWTSVANIPVTIGRDSVVTNTLIASANRFYRLVKAPQLLSVTRVGNFVVFSWPAVSSTAVLKKTTDLSATPVWTTAGAATLIGNQYYVTNVISGVRSFYRLYN